MLNDFSHSLCKIFKLLIGQNEGKLVNEKAHRRDDAEIELIDTKDVLSTGFSKVPGINTLL
jgi:hypothetical protein